MGIGKEEIRWLIEKIMELDKELAEIENKMSEKCGRSLIGILAVKRCVSQFENAKNFRN